MTVHRNLSQTLLRNDFFLTSLSCMEEIAKSCCLQTVAFLIVEVNEVAAVPENEPIASY